MKVEKEKVIKIIDDCQNDLEEIKENLLLSQVRKQQISIIIGRLDAVRFAISDE